MKPLPLAAALLALFLPITTWAQLPTPTPPPLAPCKVACVGDSITFGGANIPYPRQLQELLGSEWTVKNFGSSGRALLKKSDKPYWVDPLFQAAQTFDPGAVIIMLGTNDTKPQNWSHHGEFASDYRDLIKIFQNLPGKPRIYICRPCPITGPNKFHIEAANLKSQLPIIDRIAREMHLQVIDMNAALAKHPEMQADHVHPNTDGYALMARAAYEALTGKPAPAATPQPAAGNAPQ